MPGQCSTCRADKPWGHRDPDSYNWYCEDCWVQATGRRRKCAGCKEVKDEGHVDQAAEYWYCMPCYSERHPPPGYGAPPPHWGYGPPGAHHHDRRRPSRSRSPHGRGGKGKKGGGKGSDKGGGKGKAFKPHHATTVPKKKNLQTDDNDGPETTVMLRNIPNKFTQSQLLEEIDAEGFAGLYDFFYLPMDLRNKANVGYAFMNFLMEEDAGRFREVFEGHQFGRFRSQKVASVSPAHVQGLAKNLAQLQKKAVLQNTDEQYRPVIFRDGVRIDFDQALEEIVG
eukprot:TRINITY_DN111206_c0_g1_i1.p1 TRINITY_DN111206_c0_g1~~TRINITY_DN111206_c0_g1_i1.p1  ORF type:complete len:282 (-),score=58.95 TRINITY_DN111206_c0_g1_i1:108-953(-)